jgi:hypothetical protein
MDRKHETQYDSIVPHATLFPKRRNRAIEKQHRPTAIAYDISLDQTAWTRFTRGKIYATFINGTML